jgi:hypothetical protein
VYLSPKLSSHALELKATGGGNRVAAKPDIVGRSLEARSADEALRRDRADAAAAATSAKEASDRKVLHRRKKLRIVTVGFGTGRQKMVLGRRANPKLPRRTCTCDVSSGYTRVEGGRLASRNGRVGHLPSENPNVTVTTRGFFVAVGA